MQHGTRCCAGIHVLLHIPSRYSFSVEEHPPPSCLFSLFGALSVKAESHLLWILQVGSRIQ